jgi:hypothetical protein
MPDDAVKIPQLGFPLKIEVVFHHLEKHLNVPPFAVDSDNLLIGGYSGESGPPISL